MTFNTAIALLLLLGSLAGALRLAAIWNHPEKVRGDKLRPPAGWLFDDVLWGAALRLPPTSMVMCLTLSLAMLGIELDLVVLQAIATAAWILVMSVAASVVLFAWPKQVQFPWHRHERGAAALWHRKYDRWRARRRAERRSRN